MKGHASLSSCAKTSPFAPGPSRRLLRRATRLSCKQHVAPGHPQAPQAQEVDVTCAWMSSVANHQLSDVRCTLRRVLTVLVTAGSSVAVEPLDLLCVTRCCARRCAGCWRLRVRVYPVSRIISRVYPVSRIFPTAALHFCIYECALHFLPPPRVLLLNSAEPESPKQLERQLAACTPLGTDTHRHELQRAA